jgi:hypothetical protein
MRYLRHAPLAFWLAVVIAFTGIGAYAWQTGSSRPIIKVDRMGTPAASRVHAIELMTKVSGAYPSIMSGAMPEWATSTAALARRGLAAANSATTPRPELVTAWERVVTTSDHLATTDVNDRALVLERVALLGTQAQDVVMLVNGMRNDLSIIPDPDFAPAPAQQEVRR